MEANPGNSERNIKAPDSTLIQRYWLGRLSPSEDAEIESWFRNNPEQKALYAAMQEEITRDGWRNFTDDEKIARKDAILDAIGKTQIDSLPSKRVGYRSPYWFQQYRFLSLFVAVAMVGVLSLVAGWSYRAYTLEAHLAGTGSIYTTDRGERARITLPDGSKVELNVGSTLEVPASYSIGDRTVELMGEAVFEVSHYENLPFIVRAGDAMTKVLGTRFLVRSYPDDTATLVSVQSGRVAVNNEILDKDEQVVVFAGGSIAPKSVGQGDSFLFTQGILSIPLMKFRDAVSQLERWYNVSIQFSDSSLKDELIKGQFTSGAVTDLVEYLEWTFEIKVIRDGRVLTLLRGDT